MTDIQITPKWSEVKPQGFYVYLHRRATDGSVFYVGKGKGRRGYSPTGRSDWWVNTAQKNGVIVELVKTDLDEVCSFTLEKIVIDIHGIDNLVNMTSGGEGTSGCISSKRKLVYCSNGMTFDCGDDAADWLVSVGNINATSKIVSAASIGLKKSIYGYAFSYDKTPEQPIHTGEDAQRLSISPNERAVYCSDGSYYRNSVQASISITGGTGIASKIRDCCLGNRKSSGGLSWSYDPESIPEYIDPHVRSDSAKLSRTMCSNGMIFDSRASAAMWASESKCISVSSSAISNAIRRSGKCAGFHWYSIDKPRYRGI